MPHLPKRQKKRAYIPKREQTFGNKAYPFYNSQAWRRLSRNKRKANPMCEVFPELVADVVDHIVPVIVDERGFPLPEGGAAYDGRNLMCMSHKAHNIKRGKEAHGFQVEAKQTGQGLIPVDRLEVVLVLREVAGV